jgi:RNA polymerase sigma factor (sigma-70 family)
MGDASLTIEQRQHVDQYLQQWDVDNVLYEVRRREYLMMRDMGLAEDLRQMFLLAVCEAAKRYEPAKGTKFSSYATMCGMYKTTRVASREETAVSEGGVTGEDIPSPGCHTEEVENRLWLQWALRFLPPRDRRVLELRYGLHGEMLLLEDIAQRWRISKERVRQLERHAIEKLQLILAGFGYTMPRTECPPSPDQAP